MKSWQICQTCGKAVNERQMNLVTKRNPIDVKHLCDECFSKEYGMKASIV